MAKILNELDLDALVFFIEELREHKHGSIFCRQFGVDSDEMIVAKTSYENIVLGTTDLADDLVKIAEWIRSLPAEG